MAGPAIRAWKIATALAAENDVHLVTFAACDRRAEQFTARHVSVPEFRAEVEGADVVIIQGYLLRNFPWLAASEKVIVVDLYDPFHLESLEVLRNHPEEERRGAMAGALAELHAQLRRGDLFLCASEKQRDLWLGHLAIAGRITPATYDADPSLRELVTVVPFGLDPELPVRRAHGIKGVVPGVGPEDPVVLWGGGVYNWFDPLTVIDAVARVRERVPAVRLYFLGMKHPNPDVPEMAMAVAARRRADELGLTGRHVFFNEEWVPYERRADYLLDADVAVSAHFDQIETAFSFRTRMLDYLWAARPIVCTAGDTFGDLVDAEGLGASVEAGDVVGLAAALERLLTEPAAWHRAHENARRVAENYTWHVALAPLVEFCRAPRRARDAGQPSLAPVTGTRTGALLRRTRSDVAATVRHLRTGGPRAVASRIAWRLGRSS
ncbi:glycosyltransferase family 4 protein [Georgenia sp. EYE_87]|nr:glycosyltransferase family 4 protein [Georgenia sp. EYE_87]